MSERAGTLYLIPVTLGDTAPADVLPARTLEVVHSLSRFIVENAKSARHFLKAAQYPRAIQSVAMSELNEHTATQDIPALLAPVLAGADCGLMSEAGCPAIADPGALLVRQAHAAGINVVPLVGPSAIVLALMASGMAGQRFTFHGYLPVPAEARQRRLREIEREAEVHEETQLFIEAPYRNTSMLQSLLAHCRPDTMLCVAADLTLPTAFIATRSVAEWKQNIPDLDRRPTVFLLYRAGGRSRQK